MLPNRLKQPDGDDYPPRGRAWRATESGSEITKLEKLAALWHRLVRCGQATGCILQADAASTKATQERPE